MVQLISVKSLSGKCHATLCRIVQLRNLEGGLASLLALLEAKLALNLDEALHNLAIITVVAEHLSVLILQERLVVVALGNGNRQVVRKVLAGDRVSSEQDLIAGDGVGSADGGRSGLPRDGDLLRSIVGLDGGLCLLYTSDAADE